MKFICFLVGYSIAINALEYNVNLMWINNKNDPDQEYFCNLSKDQESYEKKCLQPILDWLLKSDDSTKVNVWYDSATTGDNLVQKATDDINERLPAEKKDRGDRLTFLDVRILLEVRNNENLFGAPVPIYFIVDLLRRIIVDYLGEINPKEYIVYADLNIPALSKEELFDADTQAKLDRFGFVMAKNEAFDPNNPYENAFFIFDPNNQLIMQAARAGLIDINLDRARTFLQRGYTKKSERVMLGGSALCQSKFPEVVYVSYWPMLAHYLYLNMALEIIFDDDLNNKIEYLMGAGREPQNEQKNDPKTTWDYLLAAKDHPLWKNKIFPYSPFFGTSVATLNDQPSDYSFTHGFPRMRYVKLLQSKNRQSYFIPLLYLSKVDLNKDNAESSVIAEKESRRNRDYKELYSVHRLSLAKPFYRLETETWHHKTTTTLVSFGDKGQLGYFLMPVKDVKKPKSSFYLKKLTTHLADDDC